MSRQCSLVRSQGSTEAARARARHAYSLVPSRTREKWGRDYVLYTASLAAISRVMGISGTDPRFIHFWLSHCCITRSLNWFTSSSEVKYTLQIDLRPYFGTHDYYYYHI